MPINNRNSMPLAAILLMIAWLFLFPGTMRAHPAPGVKPGACIETGALIQTGTILGTQGSPNSLGVLQAAADLEGPDHRNTGSIEDGRFKSPEYGILEYRSLEYHGNGGNPDGGQEGGGTGSAFFSGLRRFEIISFGTFPFTFLLSNIAYDLGRYGVSVFRYGSEDERSVELQPTLFGERNLEQNERYIILGSAAGLSLLLAAIDLLIENRTAGNVRDAQVGGGPGSGE